MDAGFKRKDINVEVTPICPPMSASISSFATINSSTIAITV